MRKGPLLGAATRRIGFLPSNIAGLKLWLDAGNLSLIDGDPITTWLDASGNANNATASGSERPLFRTSVLNGRPCARFDGTNDKMTVAAVCGQPTTYFVVGKMTTDSAYFFDGVSGDRLALGMALATAGKMGLFGGSAVIENSFTVAGSVAHLWSGTAASSNGTIFKNGTAFASSGSIGSQGLNSGMTIGNRFALSFPLNGDIEEILIYNSSLSTGNRQAVEDYLGSKYGLTITH